MSEGPEPSRNIPDPGFAGDRGEADPALEAALATYAAQPGDVRRGLEVVATLAHARVLMPVVALPGETETGADGLAIEKTSEMATVLLTGQDGRQALLAFTSVAALEAWRPDARPVPVTAVVAARSAVQEGAAALLLDVAGPTPYAVEGDLLDGLARGWTLAGADGGYGWVSASDSGDGDADGRI
jgi:hypothetical protein